MISDIVKAGVCACVCTAVATDHQPAVRHHVQHHVVHHPHKTHAVSHHRVHRKIKHRARVRQRCTCVIQRPNDAPWTLGVLPNQPPPVFLPVDQPLQSLLPPEQPYTFVDIYAPPLPVGGVIVPEVPRLTTPNPPPAVPEPASWALMILGLGITGYVMRRRRASMGFA